MGRRRRDSGVCGVAIVDKPKGMTSHDVVSRMRRLLNTGRVGHAGTLDPMATGVLVVMVGEATKLGPYLTSASKRYRARVQLGSSTTTLDAEGEVCERAPIPAWWHDNAEAQTRLAAALAGERARQLQAPPVFSAIKVGGRTSHSLARAGKPPELAERDVQVHALDVLARDDAGWFDLQVHAAKGYYVRALARDLGERLGVPAHLSGLRRTASGCFDLDQAQPLDGTDWSGALLPLSQAAGLAVPVSRLSREAAVRARHGQVPQAADFAAAPTAGVGAWLDEDEQLVAIGRWGAEDAKLLRVFVTTAAHDEPRR